jgi:hypothetical protein
MLDMTSFIAGARIAKDNRFVVTDTTFGSAPMIVNRCFAEPGFLSHEETRMDDTTRVLRVPDWFFITFRAELSQFSE